MPEGYNSASQASLTVAEKDKVVDEIIDLFKARGDENYFGEDVSKSEHCIQCALSAKAANEPDHVVLACLLHDVGHLVAEDDMGGLGNCNHGDSGYAWLRKRGVAENVCHLVKQHVAAKRFLVTTDATYYDKLSDASKQTLEFQGGKMSDTQVAEMRADPQLQEVRFHLLFHFLVSLSLSTYLI